MLTLKKETQKAIIAKKCVYVMALFTYLKAKPRISCKIQANFSLRYTTQQAASATAPINKRSWRASTWTRTKPASQRGNLRGKKVTFTMNMFSSNEYIFTWHKTPLLDSAERNTTDNWLKALINSCDRRQNEETNDDVNYIAQKYKTRFLVYWCCWITIHATTYPSSWRKSRAGATCHTCTTRTHPQA